MLLISKFTLFPGYKEGYFSLTEYRAFMLNFFKLSKLVFNLHNFNFNCVHFKSSCGNIEEYIGRGPHAFLLSFYLAPLPSPVSMKGALIGVGWGEG